MQVLMIKVAVMMIIWSTLTSQLQSQILKRVEKKLKTGKKHHLFGHFRWSLKIQGGLNNNLICEKENVKEK